MADQITHQVSKFSSLRSVRDSTSVAWSDNWKQAQNEEHALQGYHPNGVHRFRSLLQFSLGSMTDVAQILKAELHVFTAADHIGVKTQKTSGTNLKAAVKRSSWTPSGGGEGLWNGILPDAGSESNDTYRGYGHVSDVSLDECVINVMPLVRYWAPKTVKDNTGAACLAKPNYGLVLSVAGDDAAKHETVLASSHHTNTSIRPFLLLTVVLKGGPGKTIISAPNGDIASGTPQFFTGEYEPGRPGDQMVEVTIKRNGGGLAEYAWTTKPSSTDVVTSTFSVPVPASWPLQTSFDWAARVRNTRGELTPYSAPLSVRWTGTPPSLTLPQPNAVTLDSLISVSFGVRATSTAGRYRAARWRVQLRTQTAPSDPTWGDEVLWDTGPMTVPLSAMERWSLTTTVVQNLKVLYGGPGLSPGTYSWRVQAEDVFGALSPWLYAEVTTTSPYVPQPGDVVNLTGYAKMPPHRIRIFGMAANRGPGKLLAELTDASNVGASEFYNAAGEFYFTLPAIHPQVGVIEPYQCHYALELHTGEGWRGKAFGLITDFDATEDEVVFYGQDYLGLLSRSVEERFDPLDAELPTDKGGAKYKDKTISFIITDQLNKAKAMANSPVGFISVGDIASLAEKVTIYASFKQRLPFIAGLIESARAGTGRRTRLVCERNADGTFRWRLLLDPGINRPNLRMEYGGLVQGFRTVPFGNWGTAVAAVGRTITGVKVYSALAVAPGISETTYGHWPSLAMYADLDDLNDLRRRAAQAATRTAKVGKQMGIGLRVGSLSIKDGWDIADSVPVDIQRGVVDTTRFGSGWWTIWGWTWNSYPDGHDVLVLSLAPREDTVPPNPDLIESAPITEPVDMCTGHGPPDDDLPCDVYTDIDTGCIWERRPVAATTPGVLVQFKTKALAAHAGTIVLDSPPTPGNMLVFAQWYRNGPFSIPTGFTSGGSTTGAGGTPLVDMSWRRVQSGDPASWTGDPASTGGLAREQVLMEWAGLNEPTASDVEQYGGTNPPPAGNGTGVAIAVLASAGDTGTDPWFTPTTPTVSVFHSSVTGDADTYGPHGDVMYATDGVVEATFNPSYMPFVGQAWVVNNFPFGAMTTGLTEWVQIYCPTPFVPTGTNTPLQGQAVTEATTGSGTTTAYQTNYAYVPNSLTVTVGGVQIVPTQVDPATGTFTLPFAPAADQQVVISYQADDGTDTGAGNDPTPDSVTPIVPPDMVGTIILNGAGPPADDVGEVGNYYLDTTNDILYGPKAEAI